MRAVTINCEFSLPRLIRKDFIWVGNYAVIDGVTYVKSSHIVELFLEATFYAQDNSSKPWPLNSRKTSPWYSSDDSCNIFFTPYNYESFLYISCGLSPDCLLYCPLLIKNMPLLADHSPAQYYARNGWPLTSRKITPELSVAYFCARWALSYMKSIASSQGTPRFYLTAMEKNREKAWDHCYVTDWKCGLS